MPSVLEYVLVAQDRPSVERYVRQADDSWLLTAFSELTDIFEFGSVTVSIPLDEIYRGVQFPDRPGH